MGAGTKKSEWRAFAALLALHDVLERALDVFCPFDVTMFF
jgi:hypothetical protein